MHELAKSDFLKAVPVFEGMKHCVPAHAILEGNNPGRVFVDDEHNPGTACIWTTWGYLYLAGSVQNDKFNRKLSELLVDELLPALVKLGEVAPILYPFPELWENKLSEILQDRMPKKIYRRIFSFPVGEYTWLNWREQIPNGYRIERIDEHLLDIPETGAKVLKEISAFWESVDQYLKDAPGVCLLYDNELISMCMTQSISSSRAEVSINTSEAYRGRGFASITASAFIEQCLARNLSPNWECFWDHAISCHLAEKLGFKKFFDFPVYYWLEQY